MIAQGIQSAINWSIHNCAGDNIWEYNKARLWSHLLAEDSGGAERAHPDRTGQQTQAPPTQPKREASQSGRCAVMDVRGLPTHSSISPALAFPPFLIPHQCFIPHDARICGAI